MNHRFEKILSNENIRLLGRLAGSLCVRAWLVGGGLRDAVMERPVRDYDFALDGADQELPQELASRIGGKFFWLDRERRQSRVVKGRGEESLTWDFAPLRGRDILEDLALRDFTVNSLAVPLAPGASSLLDPMKGLPDIESGVIRSCSPNAFDHDPLRLVRAVRFAATLGFSIEPGTARDMRLKSHLISLVAGERVRDELCLILSAPGVGVSLETLRDTGLLQLMLPIGGDSAEELRERISRATRVETAVARCDQFFPSHRRRVADHLHGFVEGGVSVLALTTLAGLLLVPDARTRIGEACERLRLGTRTRVELDTLCDCAASFPSFPEEGREGRAFYRFFRDRQPAGPELLLLPLSERLITPELAARLVAFYFDHYRSTDADLLLSGGQVMEMLGIAPGPELGRHMERLREAESLGIVATDEEARAFIRKSG